MAGDTTVGENYAFAGMHHIFDQHTAPGKTAGHWSVSVFYGGHPVHSPIICDLQQQSGNNMVTRPIRPLFASTKVGLSNEVSLYFIH